MPTAPETPTRTAPGEHASLTTARTRSEELRREIAATPGRFRMLTGDRPTGRLHVGHYFGSLRSRVELQDLGVDPWVLVADYQVITDRDGVGELRERVLGLLADYLAVGLDPDRCTIFAHSAVPELNQLMLPFLSLVTEAELHRNPTVKTEAAAADRPLSGLLLTYPVHQAADILFCKADLVPVGKDQLPHLEQTRVIADRFDTVYGRAHADRPVFTRPEALLSPASGVLGLDGHKMSKSRGNTVDLAMGPDETARRLRKAVTDAERTITYDPQRRPGVSNLLLLTALSLGRTPDDVAAEIGDRGSGALKALATEAINEHLAPVRARRAEVEKDPAQLLEVLARGNARARETAVETLDEVRAAMRMRY